MKASLVVTFRCTVPPREGTGTGSSEGRELKGKQKKKNILGGQQFARWNLFLLGQLMRPKGNGQRNSEVSGGGSRPITHAKVFSSERFRISMHLCPLTRARERNSTLNGRRPYGRAAVGSLLCPDTTCCPRRSTWFYTCPSAHPREVVEVMLVITSPREWELFTKHSPVHLPCPPGPPCPS